MRQKFYQKTGFKNTILISIPALISVIGAIISIVPIDTVKIALIFFIVLLLITLIFSVFFFSSQEDKIYRGYEELKKEIDNLEVEKQKLSHILAHMENNYKTSIFTITTFSELMEKWSKTINSFANNVSNNGMISDKAWDKIKLIDSVCLYCKNMIKQYCNNNDDSKVSVNFVLYRKDSNGEKWVHMISHSNPESTRPKACKVEEKLSQCEYHYAQLIRDEYSDIEIAENNDEIQKIFQKTSKTSDLTKYSQYIAIPVYCTRKKLLGIFQVVTKYNYVIENDKIKLLNFTTENIIPYSNLIVLIEKIYKGLYISPKQINKED